MDNKVRILKQVLGGITAPKGFRAAGMHCGIKRKKKDLSLVVSEVPGSAAGVFTTNRVKAAPVIECQDRVKGGSLQVFWYAAGRERVCTGAKIGTPMP